MLNIGRLAPGGEGYYLDTVAAGVEDYYTGAGEAPGHWLTEAAAGLGLTGRVEPDDLRAVLGARDPSDPKDTLVSGRGGRKVPGFDLAFRAPKSVSLVWALGDEATAAVIRDAHDQAVRAAIGYLERHAARSRRGAQGHDRIAVSGLVAAAFRHRTSRAGDPLLHTHVLVSNLGCGDDGQWRTLDSPALYSHAKTAGYLYQAALREQLARRLGVEWTAVTNGTAEIVGVPRDVITTFSRRRAQILAEMAERGTHSAKGAQAATLETRQAKGDIEEPTDLRSAWATRAEALGFGAEQVAALLGAATWQQPDLTAIADDLAGAAGLTSKASTFTRRDVIQAWCQRLPAGAGVEEIERLADTVLRADAGLAVQLLPSAPAAVPHADPAVDAVVSALAERVDVIAAAELRTSTDLANSVTSLLTAGWPPDKIVSRLLERELDSAEAADAVLAWRAQRLATAHGARSSGVEAGAVIRRGDGRVIRADATEPRYSTPELLALERRLVDRAVQRSNAAVAVVAPAVVEAALQRRPSVSDEQAAMIRRLTSSGAGVDVVVGKAGAGKTFALDAAREAWQNGGIRVIGSALAARAAAELNAGAGIDSYTIDALLADLDRGPSGTGLAKGSVVVVDEAAMVGTRKLARLLDHADRASAKVVLVGDHRQLPEIDAGGVFRGLLHRLDPIHLDENRRQRQPWERAALDELRAGAPSAAITAYADAGGLTVGATADEVRESLVADWWEAYAEHGADAGMMIAARVSDVEDLNDRARRYLTTAGRLTGPGLHAAEREYREGDRIVTLHNDRRLGVFNGTRATVRSVDVEQAELLATTDDGVDVRLTAEYLDAGHVAHAYAITGHKAQGLTADRAWVLGSDEIYREWGYVALSRGRDRNRLYVVAGDRQPDGDAHCHADHDTRSDVVADLAHALDRSRGQALAIDQTGSTAGHATAPPPDREQLRRLIQAAPADRKRERQWIAEERDSALDQLSAAELRLEAATERSRAGAGRLRRRTHQHDPQPARADQQRAAADVARWRSRLDDIEQRSQVAAEAQDERARWLADYATEVKAAGDLLEGDARLDWQSVTLAEFRPPPHVLSAIGPRPRDPTERRAWRTAVEHIERYRLRHSIDAVDALGKRPEQARQLTDYERANAAIRAVETAREQITTHLDRSDSTVEQELA